MTPPRSVFNHSELLRNVFCKLSRFIRGQKLSKSARTRQYYSLSPIDFNYVTKFSKFLRMLDLQIIGNEDIAEGMAYRDGLSLYGTIISLPSSLASSSVVIIHPSLQGCIYRQIVLENLDLEKVQS